MPVLLKIKTYKWLLNIGVFRNDPLPSKIQDCCEVPYDEEIYLQNGYLIGVTLRKNVKCYSQSYKELLKVRKIATLKSSQNWQIIQPFLRDIGCDTISTNNQVNSQIQISTAALAQILQDLYDKYSPKQQEKIALAKKIKCNYVDFYNFDPNKPLQDTDNSLQFFCIILVRNLQISLGQALGLLINKCKYMKKLIIEGSKKDEFESLKRLYQQVTQVWPVLQQFSNPNPKDIEKILQGLSEGVLSQNMDIIHATLNLLSFVKQQQWFVKCGYFKLLSSTYIQCFYFTIQRLSPHYNKILNQKIHVQIADKTQLFTILLNLVKILPKTIYCKQIFNSVSINYFYQQCYSILNVDEIDDQPPYLIMSAKQLLTRLIVYFPDKIPNSYVNRILQTFKYQSNRNYVDTYHTLALLFDILESMMHKQSYLTPKFFKVAMKYLSSTFGQTRHWIIQNLRILYQRMIRSFPLGCFLMMYSLDPVAQPDQYQIFDIIAQDNAHISTEQAKLALNYLTKYVQTQIHCKCFINIINKFLKHHSKVAGKWGQQSCIRLLNRMQQINIPMLNNGQINILNPKPPSKNRVISSIGIKRKQMLKFNEYELNKQLLQILLNVNDKVFLNYYADALGRCVTSIQKQIGHNKKTLVTLLKTLKSKAKKNSQKIQQSTPMAEIARSIAMSRSAMAQTHKTDKKPKTQSQVSNEQQSDGWGQSESRVIQQKQIKQTVIEQQNQSQQNQFMSQSYKKPIESPKSPPQSLNNSQMLPQMMLLPFTQQDKLQQHNMFYSNVILQQNQIMYLNLLKDKYKHIFSFCTKRYEEILEQKLQTTMMLKQLMRDLGLSRIIQPDQVQEIFLKCKIIGNSNYQIMQNLLIQIAFRAFDFKKDRRISVLCLSSLFLLIQQNIKHKLQNFRSKSNSQFALSKNVQFQFKFSSRLFSNNQKIQSSIICFSVLNDILKKGLELNLMQPLSKMVNQFPIIQRQTPISSFLSIDSKYKTELDALEQQLEAQYIDQSQVRPKQKQPSKYRMKQPKKNLLKQSQKIQQKQESSTSPKPVNNKQLRNKLSLRLKILEEEMKKKQKSSKKMFSQPSQPHTEEGQTK